jgi:hypothetical protein
MFIHVVKVEIYLDIFQKQRKQIGCEVGVQLPWLVLRCCTTWILMLASFVLVLHARHLQHKPVTPEWKSLTHPVSRAFEKRNHCPFVENNTPLLFDVLPHTKLAVHPANYTYNTKW